jgi:MFS family permease
MKMSPVTEHRAARRAVRAFFAINGILFGTWVSRIPRVQTDVGIGEGELGIALLGAALGLISAVPPAGAVVARRGTRGPIIAGSLLYCLALPLPALAPSLPALTAALFLLGAGSGILDLSMNAHALLVERAYGRSIMSSFHASFSIGGGAGAAIGALAAGLALSPRVHFSMLAAVLAVISIGAHRHLLHDEPEGAAAPLFARPSGALVGLGVIAFCVLISEGAMADWSAVYLRRVLNADPATAALGFAGFSVMMTAGRLLGDAAAHRFGPKGVVRGGAVIVAAGLGAGLLGDVPWVAIAGFTCSGLGLSCSFPLALGAAGKLGAAPRATSLAAVTTAGYTGFLVGPPVIGFVAEVSGLRVGLGLIALLALVTYGLAGRVEPVDTLIDSGAGTLSG